MPKEGNFGKKKSSLTVILSSLGFTSLHCLFLLDFILISNKHDCNEGEDETYFSLRIIHDFVHACEACCGHLSIFFGKENERSLQFWAWFMKVWDIQRGVYGVKSGCKDL